MIFINQYHNHLLSSLGLEKLYLQTHDFYPPVTLIPYYTRSGHRFRLTVLREYTTSRWKSILTNYDSIFILGN